MPRIADVRKAVAELTVAVRAAPTAGLFQSGAAVATAVYGAVGGSGADERSAQKAFSNAQRHGVSDEQGIGGCPELAICLQTARRDNEAPRAVGKKRTFDVERLVEHVALALSKPLRRPALANKEFLEAWIEHLRLADLDDAAREQAIRKMNAVHETCSELTRLADRADAVTSDLMSRMLGRPVAGGLRS